MTFHEFESSSSPFGSQYRSSSDPPWRTEKTTLYKAPRVTTPEPLDSWGKQWSLYLSRLEDAIRGSNTVRSLYVQIGVLNYQSLITVNATGAQNKSAWLTFQFRRGPLFLMHRLKGDSSKLQLPPEKHLLFLMDPDLRMVHQYGGTWSVEKVRKPNFLTRLLGRW